MIPKDAFVPLVMGPLNRFAGVKDKYYEALDRIWDASMVIVDHTRNNKPHLLAMLPDFQAWPGIPYLPEFVTSRVASRSAGFT